MAKEKKQITRNRISYSCQKCRQRKVKCDKVHPVCGSCEKTGEECVYITNDNDNQSIQESAHAAYDNNRKRHRSRANSQDEDATANNHANSAVDLENQLARLSSLLGQLRTISGVSDTAGTALNAKEPASIAQDELVTSRSQQSDAQALLQLHQDGGLRHSGQLYTEDRSNKRTVPDFDSISAQLEQLTALLQPRQLDSIHNSVETRAQNHAPKPLGLQQAESLGALFIPSEHQRNALFRSWLSYVYPVLPIVNPHLMLIKYRTFHFWYLHGLEKGIPNPAEDHVPLIYAVYYAGMASLSTRGIRKWFPGAERQQLLESGRKQFLQTLKVSAKQLSNPVTLAAKIMMRHLTAQDKAEIGHLSTVTPLVRTAYACNLHREKSNVSFEHALAETRRRLWWEIVNLDSLEATASDMPPSINYRYCDTTLLNELKDSKLGTPEAKQYESALQGGRAPDQADDLANNEVSSMVSVVNLFMKARTVIAMRARQLLDISLATKPKTREDMAEMRKSLGEVDRYINTIITRIPTKGLPELDFMPNRSKPGESLALDYAQLYGEDLFSNEVESISGNVVEFETWAIPFIQQHRMALVVFHKWARIVLSMLIDQLHCFSYAPYLSNPKRKLWIAARQCALRHSHSCLRKFNALATDLELERFRWTWPGMYQPIHACVIALLDVYENPSSREAPRSRALVDQMLSLSLPSYGIIEGKDGMTMAKPLQESGNEAYVMLMQLRAKAWHNAGLNPTLLWTEQDQIDVGIATPLTDAEKMAQSVREDVVHPSDHAQDRNLLRPIMEERAREYTHPSMLGPPDDRGTGQACNERDHSVYVRRQNGEALLRARPDQERAPFILAHDVLTNTEEQSGHTYKFKPPSELYDLGELINRIRSFQKSSKEKQDENTATLSDEIATANSNLTDFLSQQPPENGNDAMRGHQAYIGPVPSNSSPPELPANTQPQAQPQDNLLSSSPATQATIETNSTTNASTQARQDPDTQADLVNMDFDWAKWDATFGNILDENFDAFSPGATHDDFEMDRTG